MLGERLHHFEPDAEERGLRYAGGNHVLSVLGSPGINMQAGAAPVGATMAGPVSGGAQVSNTSGSTADLGHVQIAVGALLLLSLVALVILNKVGFRFSAVIG